MVRAQDWGRSWSVFGTPINEIEVTLGIRIRSSIHRAIGNYSERKPFKVLDLGCGPGRGLKGLKDKFGGRIKTVGLVMGRTKGERYEGVDRLIVSHILGAEPMERYDLIYSHFGSTYRVPEYAVASVERVVKWLNPGGTAVLHMGLWEVNDGERIKEEITKVLKRNGIKKYSFSWGGEVLRLKKPLKIRKYL